MTDTLVRMRAAPLFAVAALAVVAPRRSLAQVPVQAPVQAPAQAPLTLDDVLQAARAANARVPIAARNVRIAQARLQEAQGRLYPRLLFDGDLHNGLPQRYATGDARFQMVGVDTLFSPALRASRTIAEFGVRSAAAGYQVAERLIAYDVRVWYSQYQQAERELAFRHEGIEKLQDYLVRVRSLRAAGQGVAADVVSTEARLGTEQADVLSAERRLDGARAVLNELMGRPPNAPLVLAPEPVPQLPAELRPAPVPDVPPDTPSATPRGATPNAPAVSNVPQGRAQGGAQGVPDVALAEANRGAAAAAIGALRAERSPQLSVSANVGAEPLLQRRNAGALLNTGTGLGGELTVFFTLPILDHGVYRARLTQAQLYAQQAQDSLTLVVRQAQLGRQRAGAMLQRLATEVAVRARTVPLARDAYLLAESAYGGGAGTTLEVLNAYSLWIVANQAYANTVLAYRQAEAEYLRWGSP